MAEKKSGNEKPGENVEVRKFRQKELKDLASHLTAAQTQLNQEKRNGKELPGVLEAFTKEAVAMKKLMVEPLERKTITPEMMKEALKYQKIIDDLIIFVDEEDQNRSDNQKYMVTELRDWVKKASNASEYFRSISVREPETISKASPPPMAVSDGRAASLSDIHMSEKSAKDNTKPSNSDDNVSVGKFNFGHLSGNEHPRESLSNNTTKVNVKDMQKMFLNDTSGSSNTSTSTKKSVMEFDGNASRYVISKQKQFSIW